MEEVTANSIALDRRSSRARRPSFCQTETSFDSKSTLNLMTGVPQGGRRLTVEHTWNPVKATAKVETRKAVANVIDRKTLYSIKREHIAARDLHFISRSPSQPGGTVIKNVEHLVEKNYIINSRLSNATPEKFPRVIMKRFYRVSSPDKSVSYGMPRPPTRDLSTFSVVMEGIKREPSVVNVDLFPSLQEPVHCDGSDEFCEILGPSACQVCIENTNRFIGEQLQHMVFPTIDMTTDKLIVPKLGKILIDGHKLQIRKRRMRELGLDIPNELMRLERKESHLTTSTCLNCKKPLKVAKIRVSSPAGRPIKSERERVRGKKRERNVRI